MSRPRIGALFALVGVVLAVAAAAPSDGATVSRRSNRLLARLDAAMLLGRVRLPPGAVASATEPAGDGRLLASPWASQVAGGSLVDAHGWWVVPGSVAAVDAYVIAHLPPGSQPNQSGTASGPGGAVAKAEGFGWPAIRGRVSTRQLVITIAPLPGGRSGVRADAQDVWITPRPTSDRIPARARVLQVELLRGRSVVAGPFAYTSGRRIARVRALINSLPSSQPGAVSCPDDAGYDIRLTFSSPGGAPFAVVNADPQGCQIVDLTIAGRRRHPLTSAGFPGSGRSPRRALIDQLDTALGLDLDRRVALSG